MRALEASKKILKNDEFLVQMDPSSYMNSLPHVPTGSFVIDYLIGGEPNANGVAPCPGLPRGKVTQVWGAESSGKSTLAQTAAAAICQQGGTCLYVDFENAIVPEYARALGVPVNDPTKFQLVQPTSLEDGLKLIMIYAAAGVDLIVIDSVGAAVPQAVMQRDVKDLSDPQQVGYGARIWSAFLPNIRQHLIRNKVALLGISQTRAKIGGMSAYGPQTEAQGGNAWKYYSDLRISMRRVEQEKTKVVNQLTHKTEERITGGKFEAKIEKCKISDSQGRKENFYITWGRGIDDLRSVIEIAVSHNIIRKSGGWYYYGEDLKYNGSEQMVKRFRSDEKVYMELIGKVRPLLAATKDAVVEDDEDIDLDSLGSSEDIEALLQIGGDPIAALSDE
jgi:recombination protein RecA